ncbi:MAG: Biofilm growth-associated repressor [Catillopecten margaritatus gill symbiont]|uniref:Biofilm growth-associated repressor n=1 Tax=Catillopecten margaritatus gill symbiont TaxID=3083288 RepID=A0AAU6PH76_9GAMM
MELLDKDKDKDIEKTAKTLKAMAHPLRLKILCMLKNDELPMFEIKEKIGTCQSNISQHIDILRAKDIVVSRREGNKTLCRIKDVSVLTLVANMQATFCSEI